MARPGFDPDADFDPYGGVDPNMTIDEIVYGIPGCDHRPGCLCKVYDSQTKKAEAEQWFKEVVKSLVGKITHKQEEDRPEKPPRPQPAKPKVTVEVAGRWRYKITLHFGWFYEAYWYRYGLERAKHKASYELYKYCKQQDILDMPAVVTYSTH